ncbi:JmjC domain hydroxylase family protein [Babesia bovis T2Bo]|uniref:JmjC domain hydroxylase family protein n=1 Tax=Babesia bovis T2Bo TaxID=484906 RepID=UPI001DC9F27C|nr:JmjC domain hydroxylase family protein [Babesia bovis T2Bo]EDO05651.2 JmjC domain hydroxylase family protein [Babesia bovis T2Bo]
MGKWSTDSPSPRHASASPDADDDPDWSSSREKDKESSKSSSGLRRSSRVIKRPSVFTVVHEERGDRDVRAAIKRSRVETQHLNIDYASLPEVPTIQLTADEFVDPVTVWNKYYPLGIKYGAIKLVPPKGWHGMCPLDLNRMKFKVREQQLRHLSNGTGFSHPGYDWDCHHMRLSDSRLLKDIFGTSIPAAKDVENEYWRIVRSGDRDLTVKYGADLNVYSPEYEEYLVDVSKTCYFDDPWNLKNLSKSPGSLLRYAQHPIPGVTSPWLYIGMGLTSFCWHTEDNYFGAVNYHHFGAPKIWYVVPPSKAGRLESLLKNYCSREGDEFAMYSLRIQVPPDVVVSNGIPVYRLVQSANEFVFAWPRAFHSGLNVGYNCNEACNIAPVSWLPMGYRALLNYRFYRKTCISYFTLVMSGVCHYRDMSASDLNYMIDALLLLIAQEFDDRSSVTYPRVQMYLYLGASDAFNVEYLFEKACSQHDFDPAGFVRALELLCSSSEDEFLEGCNLLCNVSMKDCDLCDTPTFGSCITCAHSNCTVCITCYKYHPCKCSTRVVLYRYPLQALDRMVYILKREFVKKTCDEWSSPGDYRIVPSEMLFDVDSGSLFSVSKLLRQGDIALPDVCTSTPTKSFEQVNSDVENLATTDYVTSCESLCNLAMGDVCEWDSSWFDDITAAFHRWYNGSRSVQREGEESIYGEITFTEPCSITDGTFNVVNHPRALATITKFTVRYLMLSLEEDCNYLPQQ